MEYRTAQQVMRAFQDRCQQFKNRWERFWFTPEDPITVSALRVLVGGMLFYTLLTWTFDLRMFFSQATGWQTAELVRTMQQGQWALSFWWLVPDHLLYVAHTLCLILITAFWLGLFTPVTKFFALAITISYANRVPMAVFGLDQIISILTLYLCLSPCGARFSLDRWWNDAAKRKAGKEIERPRASIAAGLTMRMVQTHLCILYFWSGISKLQGQSWWSGEAIWRVASNYEYQQVSLEWLAYVPWLYQLCTVGTWMWEISFPFLVWRRELKPLILGIGILMHLSIGLFLGMWTFGLAMCFAYVAFVPPMLLQRGLFAVGIGRRTGWIALPETEAGEGHDDPADRQPLAPPAFSEATTSVELEFELATEYEPAPLPVANGTTPTSMLLGQTSNSLADSASSFASTWAVEQSHRTDEPSPVDTTPSSHSIPSSDDTLMLNEHDFDNVILYVDSSTKRRSAMMEALEDGGIRCIGVDAWPEAIRMYNSLNLHGLLCNASRLQPTELRFWCSHLKCRSPAVHVALIQSTQLPAMQKHDMGNIVLHTIPANISEIIQLFDATHTPPIPQAQPQPQRPAAPRTPSVSKLSVHDAADADHLDPADHPADGENGHIENGHIVKYPPPASEAPYDSPPRIETRRI